MTSSKPARRKKYFTPAEANNMLPLVRSIVKDVTDLAKDLHERHERLTRVARTPDGALDRAHHEEFEQARTELERDQERMQQFVHELTELGIELKDYNMGLIDFPCRMNGREVYLCWRLGESEVAHWHEINAGFAGRQQLRAGAKAT